MTKVFIFAAILVANILLAAVRCDEDEENFRFELLEPRGFRHSFRPAFEVRNVTLHGIINVKKTNRLIGQYDGRTERHGDGWLVYKNTKLAVNPGDTFHFWEYIHLTDTSYSTAIRRYTVPDNATRNSC